MFNLTRQHIARMRKFEDTNGEIRRIEEGQTIQRPKDKGTNNVKGIVLILRLMRYNVYKWLHR